MRLVRAYRTDMMNFVCVCVCVGKRYLPLLPHLLFVPLLLCFHSSSLFAIAVASLALLFGSLRNARSVHHASLLCPIIVKNIFLVYFKTYIYTYIIVFVLLPAVHASLAFC